VCWIKVKFFQYKSTGSGKVGAQMNKTTLIIMTTRKMFALIACWSAALSLMGADQPLLNPHLAPLQPLLGKTWKGVFKDSKPEKPTVDIARWERALNGQAVRAIHSINRGFYGGETLFIWNEKKQAVEYYYFTTAGFMTTGTLEIKNGTILTREEVRGDAGGVAEVRGTSEIQPDGKFHVKVEYLKKGQWELGHEVTYQEDAGSEVVFR
jgi:hypothetical protein